jgi:hypothetical protein
MWWEKKTYIKKMTSEKKDIGIKKYILFIKINIYNKIYKYIYSIYIYI